MPLKCFLLMQLCWLLGEPCLSFVAPDLTLFSKANRPPTQAILATFAPNPRDQPRRRKENKYRKSQSDEPTKDPLELLIEDSERKLKEINQESKSKKLKIANIEIMEELEALKNEPRQFAFPDNKDIDPNEPASFGFIEIGAVVGPHGVHGEIKVKSSSGFPRRFTDPGIKFLKPRNKRAPRKVILVSGKPSRDGEFILKLYGVLNREDAKRLRGATLFVREEERESGTKEESNENHADPEEEEEEFFISDLVGLEVFLESVVNNAGGDANDLFVGTVAGVVLADEICATPGLGHDMLEVNLPRGKGGTVSFRDELVLIPFVPQIVPRVAIAEGKVFISPPAGLLDLTYVREEKVRIKGFLPYSD